MFRIGQLARQFGLSRSTLLYYDRIGLLSPSGRSGAEYRLYSPEDRKRLESICAYRRAGLTIEDIRTLLALAGDDDAQVLGRRLRELGEEIRDLQAKQRLLAGMLKFSALGGPTAEVDKKTWVAMLRAAGMDDRAMDRWHAEFERRAPEAHHRFLISLGITEAEALLIRRSAAGG
jgi:MerR family transcriptional regulator, thiopeptide resistance regulator